MTKKEALIAVLQVTIPDISLEKALIDQGITGSESYSLSSEKEIDLCAISIYRALLAVPDLKEGDMSISYDRQGLQSVLLSLATKHGVKDIVNQYKPSVTGKSVW
jgi:hypothetical protein